MVKQAIFKRNQNGYTVFRLPAVIYHQGTFLTFCEGRYGVADRSVADIVLRRGTLKDSTVSWDDIQVIDSKATENIRLHNHVPLIDYEKNTIFVLYKDCKNSFFFAKSTDVGKTWSSPVNITKQILSTAPSGMRWLTSGPGHGVQLKSGRLVVQGYMHVKDESGVATSHACAILSDDHGETWYCGGYVAATTKEGTRVNTNETAVAVVAGGTICLNSRTLGKDQPRAQSFSQDGGKTFSPPQLIKNLIEPKNIGNVSAGCEGGLLGFQPAGESSKPWVLFSNPASTWLRLKLSIRLSQDGCQTWSKPWRIRWFPCGYSDMTQYEDVNSVTNNNAMEQTNQTFAIAYESGYTSSCSQVTFQTFTIKDVLQGTS